MEQSAMRDTARDDAAASPQNLTDLHGLTQASLANSAELTLAAGKLPQITLSNEMEKGEADAHARSVVVVDKTHHETHVLQMHDGKVEDVLTVADATGKGPKMTPEGRFHITEKTLHPTWYP